VGISVEARIQSEHHNDKNSFLTIDSVFELGQQWRAMKSSGGQRDTKLENGLVDGSKPRVTIRLKVLKV
jgi:hypothetical protein